MKVLAVNCGSSSLKFQVFDVEDDPAGSAARRLAGGAVDGIGAGAVLRLTGVEGTHVEETVAAGSHEAAVGLMLDRLEAARLWGPGGPDAVGHRVVHGGDRLHQPALIDKAVMAAIEAVSALAPLHNGPALAAIRAARAALGDGVPMVATFDTAFHRTLPERAARYALPRALADRHGIRRYGFHGLAHRWMMERYAALTDTPPERTRLVTLQLGSGCSLAAIDGGRSVDTSMGFTPLEGLMMGTRSGDLDPSLVAFLAAREGVGPEVVEDWLNTRSGLLGVSEQSADIRVLLAREQEGDARAALAVEMFCYRARKYLGAYLAALGGADAVVFGGGIGEHAPAVRSRICAGMGWCGLTLDEQRNAEVAGAEARISAAGAGIAAYVIPVDEEIIIARDTARCLRAVRH